MDCSPPDSSVHGDSPGKNTGVDCHALLPIQGSNPGLLHCRWVLYCLSPRETQKYSSGYAMASPGDLPNPEIEPGSPALQVDSLPAEWPESPLMRGIQMKEWNIHWGKRHLGITFCDFSPQFQFPKRRRDFCPYLDQKRHGISSSWVLLIHKAILL